MGFDYALVHLRYTIPPAVVLTLIYRPFFNRIDLYKIAFLITIAVTSTTPWDSYLIQRKIWTYPPTVILGLRWYAIPAEEVFFFVIQTYNTALLYLILSKPLFHPSYLSRDSNQWSFLRCLVLIVITALVATGSMLIWDGKEGTYMGLILAWAGPFVLLLWSISSDFLLRLPSTSTVLPIVIPTLYLWVVDTVALRRGTWAIESGTKLGIHLWDGLEIEEAVFFLATNTLIVFGLIAFDHALAILLTFPAVFPDVPGLPSPTLLVRALLMDRSLYDQERVAGIQEAVERLQKKSRSFYLASASFSGRLRIDLVLLYSFCRVADDLIDNAQTKSEACEWIGKLSRFLDVSYASKSEQGFKHQRLNSYIAENFPEFAQSALRLLPTHLLSHGPLYDLLDGFRTDLEFPECGATTPLPIFPILGGDDLELYAARVAGTVAEMCLQLVFHHTNSNSSSSQRNELVQSGGRMGIALQYVNIARDVAVDAAIGRVYLPTSWLEGEDLTHDDILEMPSGPRVEQLRRRLLEKAFGIYHEARSAMMRLPVEARAPMRVVVESYMEIGRVLGEKGVYHDKKGRATVPKFRRLRVAWAALNDM